MSSSNYSPNPSFEANLTGYTFVNCTATRFAFASPGTGSYSAKMVATGGNPVIANHTITGLVVGNRYNASFYSYVDTTVPSFSMQPSVGAWTGTDSKLNNQRWTRQWVAFTALTTSVTLTIQSLSAVSAGSTVYIDRIKVTDGEFMGPYFDGNYPYSSWSGTANNSASTCTAFIDSPTTGGSHGEDPVLANGLCLNNLAWNISSKSGRYYIPGIRGNNTTVPGQRGQTFVKNKPVDVGIWTIQMWILGVFPDGSSPGFSEMKRIFDANYNQIMQQVMSVTSAIQLMAWQDDGSVRKASGTIGATTNSDLQAGGRRGEITLAFEILEGAWADYTPSSIVGTAGTHWSNDTLVMTALAGGSAPIENAVLTVNGPITTPRITDPITGTWVQYNGVLSSTDTWVVDSGNWTSTVNGVGQLINTQHYGHPRFLVIDSGQMGRVPQVTMTGASTGVTTNLTVNASRQHWSA